jgi:hypothetical protein
MTLGLIIVLVTLCGYASNWLNWKLLNSRVTRASYRIGTLVHEGSHALLCLVTGAKIREFSFMSQQPHVIHSDPKLPIIGKALISSAPIFGGMLFLFLLNLLLFDGIFTFGSPLDLLAQLNPLQWQSWVLLLVILNAGAMLGPSLQDLRNMWPVLLILCFVNLTPLADIGLMALNLITANIVIQCALIIPIMVFKKHSGTPVA